MVMQNIDNNLQLNEIENPNSINTNYQNNTVKLICIIDEAHVNWLDEQENYRLIRFSDYLEAAYFLQNFPPNSGKLPEAILGYYNENKFKDILLFAEFLHKNSNLFQFPFILLKHRKSETESKKPISITGVDDIAYDDISHEDLSAKIALLKKFKKLKQKNILKNTANKIPKERAILYKMDPYLKRAMDIIISILSLIILTPILSIISIIIRLESRGPVFYTSYRAGSGYRIFKFYKFRTMVVDAEEKRGSLNNQYKDAITGGPVFFKAVNDPRITKFGSFLRNTSLDELPQLINILKGDMSLVGNRPLPLYEAVTLTTDEYVERFMAPAGITGLWQVNKRGKPNMSVKERVGQDITYARKRSFFLDCKIIWHTPRSLIQKEKV